MGPSYVKTSERQADDIFSFFTAMTVLAIDPSALGGGCWGLLEQLLGKRGEGIVTDWLSPQT